MAQEVKIKHSGAGGWQERSMPVAGTRWVVPGGQHEQGEQVVKKAGKTYLAIKRLPGQLPQKFDGGFYCPAVALKTQHTGWGQGFQFEQRCGQQK